MLNRPWEKNMSTSWVVMYVSLGTTGGSQDSSEASNHDPSINEVKVGFLGTWLC